MLETSSQLNQLIICLRCDHHTVIQTSGGLGDLIESQKSHSKDLMKEVPAVLRKLDEVHLQREHGTKSEASSSSTPASLQRCKPENCPFSFIHDTWRIGRSSNIWHSTTQTTKMPWEKFPSSLWPNFKFILLI